MLQGPPAPPGMSDDVMAEDYIVDALKEGEGNLFEDYPLILSTMTDFEKI